MNYNSFHSIPEVSVKLDISPETAKVLLLLLNQKVSALRINLENFQTCSAKLVLTGILTSCTSINESSKSMFGIYVNEGTSFSESDRNSNGYCEFDNEYYSDFADEDEDEDEDWDFHITNASELENEKGREQSGVNVEEDFNVWHKWKDVECPSKFDDFKYNLGREKSRNYKAKLPLDEYKKPF